MDRLLVVRCPPLAGEDDEGGAGLRAFARVIGAVETYCPWVSPVRLGICSLPARGPSRYFGGEHALVELVTRTVEEVVGEGDAQVGVADGLFAAILAARAGVIVPAEGSPAFLASFPLDVLGRPELTDMLARLGIRTLGQFASLPQPHVLGRFGADGVLCHRVAGGQSGELDGLRVPDVARRIARWQAGGGNRPEAPSSPGRGATGGGRGASGGEEPRGLPEAARHDEAWDRAGAGIDPDPWGETEPGEGADEAAWPEPPPAQPGFWGGASDADARAGRALAAVQRLLGPEGVVTARLQGGRGPTERARFVTWAERGGPVPVPVDDLSDRPWPGRIPPPAPATVYRGAVGAELVDSEGKSVAVSGRGLLTATPDRLSVDGGRWQPVLGWAGPWPSDERWWSRTRRRSSRVQVVAGDSAHLLVTEHGRWWVEATYA